LSKNVYELKDSSNKEYLESKDGQARLGDAVLKVTGKANKMVEASSAAEDSLASTMSATAKSIRDAKRNEFSADRAVAANSNDALNKGYKQALFSSQQATGQTAKKLEGGIQLFDSDAAQAIAGDEAKLKEYMSSVGVKLDDLSSRVKETGSILGRDDAAVERRGQTYMSKLHGLGKQEKDMESKGVEDLGEQKLALTKNSEALNILVGGTVGGFTKQQKENLRGLDSERASLYNEELQREGLGRVKLAESEGQWTGRMEGEIQGIDKSAAATEGAVKSFWNLETGSEKRMQSETAGLGTAIEIGEQKVEGQIQHEEKVNTDGGAEGLGGMEKLLGEFSGAKGAAAGEIDKMNMDFQDELNYYKGTGEQASREIAGKIAEMDGSSVDLAAQFMQETLPAEQALLGMEAKYGKQITADNAQISTFHSDLYGVRKLREKEAIKLHDETSNFKRTLLTQINDNLDGVSRIEKTSDARFHELEQKQRGYDRSLAKVSGFSGEQDEGQMNEMMDKMWKLEQSNKNLVDWQKTFKHHTLAWRQEVERGIRKLNGEMEENESEGQEARLNEEMNANGQMRSTQRGVEDDVAKNAREQSGRMNRLVDGMQEQMGAVMNKEGDNESADSAGLNRLSNQLHSQEAGEGKGMYEFNSKQNEVESESFAYRAKIASEQEKLDNELLLPKMSVSPNNLRLEDQAKRTETRINQMGNSLLETNDKIDGKADSESLDEERAALKALNAELTHENANLAKADDTLDSKIGQITNALQHMVGMKA